MSLDRDRPTQYRDQRERDGAMEARYTLWCNGETKPWEDKPCCGSLLQHIATHTDGLVAEYMQWVNDSHEQHAYDTDALARWEVERFGDRAYVSAHAVLLYAVKVAVFGDPYKRARKPEPRQAKLTPGLTDEERKDRMLTALDKVAESKAMPTGPQGQW